jgi:hypothetical protein
MDPVNPWLDPAEVRHLAEQLLRPVAPARIAAADPGFDSAFVGFTQTVDEASAVSTISPSLPAPPPSPVVRIEEKVIARESVPEEPTAANMPFQVKRALANDGFPDDLDEIKIPTKEEAAASISPSPAPPLRPSKTRFLERIHIFRDWLEKNFNASDVFILDKEGRVIFDESGHGRLHFMARNLALASRGASSQSGNIHVKIGPSAVLEVIPCETAYGRIVLGALVPDSLPAQHIATITEVLIQTASPA